MRKKVTQATVARQIGSSLARRRRELHKRREAVAPAQFSRIYISAIERGVLLPSRAALGVLAEGLQLSEGRRTRIERALIRLGEGPGLVESSIPSHGMSEERALQALNEDVSYQLDIARMQARNGNLEEALRLVDGAELHAGPRLASLPASTRYRLSQIRGVAYLQVDRPSEGIPHLHRAIEIAETNSQESVSVRNLLGCGYYQLERPEPAIEYHRSCLEAVHLGVVRDFSLQFSIIRNLANDYCMLHDYDNAIVLYKQAIELLEDLDDPMRLAHVCWGLATCYQARGNLKLAQVFSKRAVDLFESQGAWKDLVANLTNLGELLVQEGRFDEVTPLIEQANELLRTRVSNDVIEVNLLLLRVEHAMYRHDLELAEALVREAIEIAGRLGPSLEEALRQRSGDAHAHDGKAAQPQQVFSIHARANLFKLAAMVADRMGNGQQADSFFTEAQGWAGLAGKRDVAHAVSIAYAESLERRGALLPAMAQYKIAAQHAPVQPRGTKLSPVVAG